MAGAFIANHLTEAKLAVTTQRSGSYLSTMLSPCHGQPHSFYQLPVNAAYLACSISIYLHLYPMQRSNPDPVAICTQFKPQFLCTFRFSIFFSSLVSYNIGPDPVFVRSVLWNFLGSWPFSHDLVQIKICFVVQLLLLDTGC